MTPAEKLAYLNDDFKKLKEDILTKKWGNDRKDDAVWRVEDESETAKAERLNPNLVTILKEQAGNNQKTLDAIEQLSKLNISSKEFVKVQMDNNIKFPMLFLQDNATTNDYYTNARIIQSSEQYIKNQIAYEIAKTDESFAQVYFNPKNRHTFREEQFANLRINEAYDKFVKPYIEQEKKENPLTSFKEFGKVWSSDENYKASETQEFLNNESLNEGKNSQVLNDEALKAIYTTGILAKNNNSIFSAITSTVKRGLADSSFVNRLIGNETPKEEMTKEALEKRADEVVNKIFGDTKSQDSAELLGKLKKEIKFADEREQERLELEQNPKPEIRHVSMSGR